MHILVRTTGSRKSGVHSVIVIESTQLHMGMSVLLARMSFPRVGVRGPAGFDGIRT